MGGWKNNGKAYAGMAVFSQDRTKWIKIKLELPYWATASGAIYLNGEIYLFGGFWNPKALYKLDKNLKWIRLADMNVGRENIENSCLEWNGYIWVFGGYDENDKRLKSVERYDPKENKWTLMADMKYARTSAAAAVWNNKIIICGGFIGLFNVTDTAECYNPEDNSWNEFTHLPTPLWGHSFVTYENNFILFGGSSNGTTNAVWKLDPQESNRTWKPLEPMKYPSDFFTGIILNQEIYAIGGQRKARISSSRVEIFDGERWRDGAALPYSWSGMSSVIIPPTLADRLSQYKKETAVVNTAKRKFTSETILVVGGLRNNGYAGMAVLSQNRTKWIKIKLELPYKAAGSGAIYLNGEIYLFGDWWNLKALYKLDKNLKWIRLADMNVGRSRIQNSCLEWNGYIWVFGGLDVNKGYLKSVERYDPKENKWTLMADMKHVRSHAAATLWNNKIIICGGWNEQSTLTKTAECYNPEDNSSIEFTYLPEPIWGHSLVTYENKFILFGGWVGKEATNAVWQLDPQESNSTWKPLEPMKYPSTYFAGKIFDQEIYAIGGRQKEYLDLSRVEIFDGKRWRDGAALPYSWTHMSSVIIPPTLADRLCQYKKE